MFAALATWAAGRLGKLGGKLLEVIVALALLIVLVGGPYWLGMRHQSQADAAVQARAQAVAAQKLVVSQAAGAAIAAKLADAQAHVRTVYQTITKEVPHVVTVYRPAPGAALEPLPRAVFTRGFVGLWNGALDPGLSATTAGAAATATGAGAAADPELDSGVSEGDVLRNHVANAETCTAIRQQLTALIAWHRLEDHR